MAQEISKVSGHVKGTTAAVVSMHSAVIAAEAAGAEKICANVNRGFFTMLTSQISQKIASKKSRVEALLMMLNQQQRKLRGIKTNMEREYGRIAARYLRIFTSINKEMEQRIKQADQPVFELVNKNMTTISNRMNKNISCFPLMQKEDLTLGQSVMVSKMKGNAMDALSKASAFLMELGQQRVLTGEVLLDQHGDNVTKTCHIPVLLMESVTDQLGNVKYEARMPHDLDKAVAYQIESTLLAQKSIGWKETPTDSRVAGEFANILAQAKLPPKVDAMVRSMFANAHFETL